MFDPGELLRISTALMSALNEAQAYASAGNFGTEFAGLVRHLREMHELMAAAVDEAGDALGPRSREIVAAMGERVRDLDGLVGRR